MKEHDYRLIHEEENYRIVEILDEYADIEDLKGDTYTPECHPDIPAEQIREGEKAFEEEINREGVYGYLLLKWNPEIDHGWEHVDSCYGFVGQYEDSKDSRYHHYIVDEMKEQIKEKRKRERVK